MTEIVTILRLAKAAKDRGESVVHISRKLNDAAMTELLSSIVDAYVSEDMPPSAKAIRVEIDE